MALTLTCHSCSTVLSAATEDELVEAHTVEHGTTHHHPETTCSPGGSVTTTVFPAVFISRFLLPASGRRR
jgi:hypothetical protein